MLSLKKSSSWRVIIAVSLGALILATFGLRLYFNADRRWKSLNQQAEQLTAQGRMDEALAASKKALDIAQQKFDPKDSRLLTSMESVARLDAKLGKTSEAQELAQPVLDALDDQTQNLWAKRKFDDALPAAARSLDFARAVFGNQDIHDAKPLENLAQLYSKQGRVADAEQATGEALDIAHATVGPDDLRLADALQIQATVLTDENKYASRAALPAGATNSTSSSGA